VMLAHFASMTIKKQGGIYTPLTDFDM